MFFHGINNDLKLDDDSNDLKLDDVQFSVYSKIYIFFCNRKQFLNHKILSFFFHIIFLSVKDFEFFDFKVLKGSKFISTYKVIFLFLKFVYFVIHLVNNKFGMNNEKFFSDKKDLVEFLIYYKFYLFVIFLKKKKKFKFLIRFTFNLYLNYLLYSIFYFLKVYLVNIQNLELKKKKENKVVYSVPVFLDLKVSSLFYKNNIFSPVSSKLISKKIFIEKEEIPLYLFCSNRVNFKGLDDSQFSIFLNNIRCLYRLINKNQNSYEVLNEIVKRAIPLSKIIYQRRGRNFIPLMTFVYSQDIRISLGLKHLLNISTSSINGLVLKSYKNQLLMNFLDILTVNRDTDFIYQSDKDSDVRKEAYSKGYYLKTFKAKFKKL